MKNLMQLIFLGTVLIFSGCGLLNGDDNDKLNELLPPENELIPLEVGNYWVYEQWYLDPSNKDTVREEIIGTRRIIAEDNIADAYKSVRFRYDSRPADDALIALKANGPDGHYFLGGWTEIDSLYINNRRYAYPAEAGDSLESRQILFDTEMQEYKIGSTRTIELMETNRTITTPAGVFENCYVYRHQDYNRLFPYYQYIYVKPGIGIVGGKTVGTNDSTNYAGEYFLIDYKVE